MKNILFGLLMLAGISAYAQWGQYTQPEVLSSFTASNDSLQYIDDTRPGDILVGAILSTEATNSLELYDSSQSASNQIAVIGTESPLNSVYIPFGVTLSSGLTYTTDNNGQGITILYIKTWRR